MDMTTADFPINTNLASRFQYLVPMGAWVLAFAEGSLPDDITAANVLHRINITRPWEIQFMEKEEQESNATGPVGSATPRDRPRKNREKLDQAIADDWRSQVSASTTSQQFNIRLAQLAKQHTANVT